MTPLPPKKVEVLVCQGPPYCDGPPDEDFYDCQWCQRYEVTATGRKLTRDPPGMNKHEVDKES